MKLPIPIAKPKPRIELSAPAASNNQKAVPNEPGLASIFQRVVERGGNVDLSSCDFRSEDKENLVMHIQKCLTTIYHAIQVTTPQKTPRTNIKNYAAAEDMQKRWSRWFSDSPKYNHAPERPTLLALSRAVLERMIKDLLNDLMQRTVILPGGPRVVRETPGYFGFRSTL